MVKEMRLRLAKEKTYSLKEEIKSLTDKLIPIDNELRSEIIRLPNLPHESVPSGYGADDNVKSVKEVNHASYI
jgi:seryl-tRNA synthetase